MAASATNNSHLQNGLIWWFKSTLALMAFVLATTITDAYALETPSGKPVLVLDGSIKVANNSDGTAAFDIEMLEALGSTEIVTQTPWTEGDVRFEGVRVRDLLAAVGAQGQSIHAVAINDYAVDIPIADFQKYDVILAYRANGKRMRIRDKGPLWVIYPWAQHPELRDEVYHARSIWQVKRLIVK